MIEFTIERAIDASAETVFETITDHEAYPEFTPIRRAVIERPGDRALNGVGAVRALHLAGPPIREEILDYEPGRLLRYRVLSGIPPLRSQVGTVSLEPAGSREQCVMSYEIEAEPLVPYTGGPLGLAMRAALGRLVAGVAGEAERRAGGDG
jgi:uncharacterized protein YndB with AHSA1/START domain